MTDVGLATSTCGGRPGTPVIVAWSAVSPFGIGADAFRAGLLAGFPAGTARGAPPGELVRQVPDFEPREALGRKGTRAMDRVTALAVATAGQLVERACIAPRDRAGGPCGVGTAVVLGTTTGSAQSMMDFTRSSLTSQLPFFVDPARFPNTVMNRAAGQCAIWYGLRGPNATIAGGRTACLLALSYASRLQRSGRAGTVLCGAAEEVSEARSWLNRLTKPATEPAGVLGEGCAMFRLEPSTTTEAAGGLAEVMALEFGVADSDRDSGQVLASCLRGMLDRAEVAPEEVWAVAPSDPPGADGKREEAAIAAVVGTPRLVPSARLLGDTSAVSASFQIAALLTVAGAEGTASGRAAVVTAVDPDGTVGCAVMRMLAGALPAPVDLPDRR